MHRTHARTPAPRSLDDIAPLVARLGYLQNSGGGTTLFIIFGHGSGGAVQGERVVAKLNR